MSPYGTLRVFFFVIRNGRSVRRTLLTEYSVTETQARELFAAFQQDNLSLAYLNGAWQPDIVQL